MAKKALVFSDDGVIMALDMVIKAYAKPNPDTGPVIMPYVKSAAKYMRKKAKNA